MECISIYRSTSTQATEAFGISVARVLSQHIGEYPQIVLLSGALGSGKTTFVQAFAKGLGMYDRIVSPTFVIHKQYEIPGHVHALFHHVDLYRLLQTPQSDIRSIYEACRDPHSIICIEWPDHIHTEGFSSYHTFSCSVDEHETHEYVWKTVRQKM